MKRDGDYLEDMLEYIQHLKSFHVDDKAALLDIKTQLAVRKAYEVLGEIAKRLPESLLQRQPQIAWKQLKGMRDVLIHRYDDVDLRLMWDALQKLPRTARRCRSAPGRLTPDEDDT